jgi:hypothetical protein
MQASFFTNLTSGIYFDKATTIKFVVRHQKGEKISNRNVMLEKTGLGLN